MRKCNHFVVGCIAGRDYVGLLEVLPLWVMSISKMYWVGIGEPPADVIERCAKEFMKYKYCPKCGVKLDFSKVRALFAKEELLDAK